MIEVQIAATLERGGVGAVRWVLVDPDELARQGPPPAPRARAEASAMAPARPGAPLRAGLGVRAAMALVLLAALVGAWGVSAALVETRAAAPSPAPRR